VPLFFRVCKKLVAYPAEGWLLLARAALAVLELRGALEGLAPLVQALPTDPHYRLALRSRHKAPLKTF